MAPLSGRSRCGGASAAASLSLLLACAIQAEFAGVPGGKRFEAPGYSFAIPPGPWYEVAVDSPLLPMVSTWRFSTSPWRDPMRARSIVFEVDGEPGPAGTWAAYRRAAPELHEPSVHALVDERWEPGAGPGRDCVRFETRLTHWHRKRVQHTWGVACRHPDRSDVGVALLWRRVILPGSSEAEPPGREQFLSSLEFTADRPVPLTPNLVQDYSGVERVLAIGRDVVWAETRGMLTPIEPRSAGVLSSHVSVRPESSRSSTFQASAAVELDGALWVATQDWIGGGVRRVDLETWAVSRLDAPEARYLAGSEASVFLSGKKGLHRVRTADGSVTQLRAGRHGPVAIAGGALWAVDEQGPALVALDVRDGTLRPRELPLHAVPDELVPAGDALVLVFGPPRAGLVRIDAASGEPRAEAPLASAPLGACFGRGLLWVSLPEDGVLRGFEAASLEKVRDVPLRSSSGLACDERAIWTTVRIGSFREAVRLAP